MLNRPNFVDSKKACWILLLTTSILLSSACSNPRSNGVKSDRPATDQDIVEEQNLAQTARRSLIAAYQSSELIPEVGSFISYESRRNYSIASGTKSCSYRVQERFELMDKSAKIGVQVQYFQTRLSSDSACPERNPFLVDHTVSFDPKDFFSSRQSEVLMWTEPDFFLSRFVGVYTSAELLSVKNETWNDQPALRFRLLVKNENNEKFYVDSVFSKANSFWGFLEAEEIQMNTGKSRKIKSVVDFN